MDKLRTVLHYKNDEDQNLFIYKNKDELLDYIKQNAQALGMSPEDSKASIIVLIAIYDYKKFTQNLNKILPLLRLLITRYSFPKMTQTLYEIFEIVFTVLCNDKCFKIAFEFFSPFSYLIEPTKFNPYHNYITYLSYQIKNYSYIEQLLNSYVQSIMIVEREIHNEHAMFYFYKGLIHLRLREFEKAYIAFACCLKPLEYNKMKIITSPQFNAIKYTILLSFLPSLEKYFYMVSYLMKYLPLLKQIKDLTIYLDIFIEKNKNMVVWINKNQATLKSDKLLGLSQVVFKELEMKALKLVLQKYNRIQLDSLVKKTLMSKDSIIGYLKVMTLKNELNIQYDEVDDVIKVMPINYCNPNLYDNLKKNYQWMTLGSNNMFKGILNSTEILTKEKEQRLRNKHSGFEERYQNMDSHIMEYENENVYEDDY